jgi:polyphosphate glucokinase
MQPSTESAATHIDNGVEARPSPKTLCVDIGGSGIKAIVVDGAGKALGERKRVETPQPAHPEAVLGVVEELAREHGDFDRISVGFPGVVVEGVTRTAPNLDPSWAGFALGSEIERRLGKPTRVNNDAGLHGMAVIEGKGVEVVVALGTGMGFGLYVDGHYVPNIELAHHPFKKGRTYEERISNAERKRIGNKRWNGRVREVIAVMEPIFNYRKLYLGGGNAKKLDPEGLPENVRIVDGSAGLTGGFKLWA